MARSLDRHFVNVRNVASPKEKESRRPTADWIVPDASMFFWVKLHLPLPALDITTFVRNIAVPHGILVLPGSAAFPEDRQTGCVRLSFSLLTDEEMEEGVKRLAEAVLSLSKSAPEEVHKDDSPAAANGALTKIRDSGVCIAEVAVGEEAEEFVVYHRSLIGPDVNVKLVPPPPSSSSNYSSCSNSTLHPPSTSGTTSLAEKCLSPSGQSPQFIGPDKSSVVFPESPQDTSQREPFPHRFTARLRRASSTFGLKFKSLARSQSSARLTEGALKIRTSVVGLREKTRI